MKEILEDVMTKKDIDENNMSDTPDYRISNIIFENKSGKSKFVVVFKITTYLILAALLGAIMSNILIKHKYGYIIEQVDEIKGNNSTVILNYAKIIKEVSPSLVSISDSKDKLLGDEYYEDNITGVIIDSNGIILTNYSGIKNDKSIFVKLSSAAAVPLEAKILVENKEIDLAVLKIDFEGELESIRIAEADSIREGQGVVVLGNAIGDEYVGSVIPSRTEKIKISNNREHSLLQINAPINEKNTGGAICNAEGKLVGLANLTITKEKNEPGLYYGLQMQELQDMINSTNSLKKILGIDEGGIIVDDTNDFNGFYIQELDKSGSAYKAGIKPTDIIIEIDGIEIINVEDIISILENKNINDILKCEVLSDGELKEIDIKISG